MISLKKRKKTNSIYHIFELSLLRILQGICFVIIIEMIQKSISALIGDAKMYPNYFLTAVIFLGCSSALGLLVKMRENSYYYALVFQSREEYVKHLSNCKNLSNLPANEQERMSIFNAVISKKSSFNAIVLPSFLSAVVQAPVLVFYGIHINLVLAVCVLSLTVFITTLQYFGIKKSETDYEEGERKEAEFLGFLRQTVSNHEIVQSQLDIKKICNEAENRMAKRDDLWLRAMIPFFKNSSLGTGVFHLVGFFSIVSGALSYYLGGVSIGGILAIYRVSQRMADTVGVFSDFFSERTSVKGLRNFADEFMKADEYVGTLGVPDYDKVSFECVSYKYADSDIPAVCDVSFSFEKGKMYYIKGANGSGKSTLGKLLAGILTPTSGVIKMGNVPVESIERKKYAEEVIYCGQKAVVFPGTILENISGDLGCGEDIRRILTDFGGECASHLLVKLNEKITEQKVSLSAGELQLVMFMRIISHRTGSFYIFDEITGSLDEDTKKRVIKVMRDLVGRGAAVLFISHDSIIPVDGDCVITVREGRIHEKQ